MNGSPTPARATSPRGLVTTTAAGRAADEPKYHDYGRCLYRVNPRWECSCGLTERIIAVESEAAGFDEFDLRGDE